MIAMSIFCQYMVIFSIDMCVCVCVFPNPNSHFILNEFLWNVQLGFAAGYGMACMQWVQWFYVCDDAQNIQVSYVTQQTKWSMCSVQLFNVFAALSIMWIWNYGIFDRNSCQSNVFYHLFFIMLPESSSQWFKSEKFHFIHES